MRGNYIVLLILLRLSVSVTALDKREINDLYLKTLLGNLNETADPCEDFYQFACGNWHANLSSAEYLDMPGYMDYLVNQQLLTLLQTPHPNEKFHESVRTYYRSCKDLAEPVLNPFLRLVQKDLDLEWPIFRSDWNTTWTNESNFDWLDTIAGLRVYGLNGVFLTQHISVRLANGSHHLLEVHQHESPANLQHDAVSSIFTNFGLTQEDSDRIAAKVLCLQEALTRLTGNLSAGEASSNDGKAYRQRHKEYTMLELKSAIPTIDWLKYFRTVLGREVNATEELVQTYSLNDDYFQKLDAIFKSTTNETIAYYIMLKFMYHLNVDLPTTSQNRSMHCIELLRGQMPLAMNYLYEKHLFGDQRRRATEMILREMYNELRFHFKQLVRENHLKLNRSEQVFVLKELRLMQLRIGNVPRQLSGQFVEQYYGNLSLSSDDFYGNHLQLLRHRTHKTQLELRNIVLPPEEDVYELGVSTSTSSSPVKLFNNVILVPHGYLQMPLFHELLDPLYQYSLFGFILAHEIVHAFDLFHIVYDQFGNYNSMGAEVAQHFWEYIDCFAAAVNDNFSENIADVAGVRLAYRTYFEAIDEYEDTARYPGKFSKQQLFFINSVQFLCANMPNITAMAGAGDDLGHDMHDIRVRQNWANFEEFSSAFKCSAESTMNPIKKCRLW